MFEGLFQPTHLLVLFGIAVLVFGGKKIPELGRESGKGSADLSQRSREKRSPQPQTQVSGGVQTLGEIES